MHIKNLSFTFSGQQKPFFKYVNIHLQPDKLNALSGQNGAGKSTLLKILSGHLTGDKLEGTITFDNGTSYNAEHNQFPQECIQHIRLVQQDIESMLAPQFTARENLQLACLPKHPTLKSLPTIDIARLQAKLPFDLATPVHELSGGQRQLLAIAMALQQNPRVLLLDEPTAALDTKNAHEVMRTLQQLAHATSTVVVMVCHNPELVAEYADICVELKR